MTLVPSHWERGRTKWDTAMVAGAFSGREGASTKSAAEPWLPPTPSHWRVVQLGLVNDTVAGYAFPSDGFSADEDHVRLLRGVNVKPERINWTDTVYWDVEAAAVPSEFVLKVGDLVFGMDRPFVGGGVRVAAISGNDLPAVLLQRVMRIRPNDEAGRGYMRYVMSTDAFFNYLEPLFTGVSVPHVSEWQVRKFKMPFPPLDEQKSIADYLDRETARIDTLIEEQLRLIDMLRERRTAAIAAHLEPLGGMTRLKHVSTVQTGVTLSGEGDPADSEWPYLRVANVQVGRVDLREIKTIRVPSDRAAVSMLQAGDVLMTEGGDIDKLGRGALWRGEVPNMLHQNHIFAVRPSEALDSEFLVNWLDGPVARTYFRTTAKQTTNLAGTNKWTLGNLPVPAPPVDEQRRVAGALDEQTTKIDALIAETERFIELSKERRAALIAAAVTGQIDVREMA